ncbi:type II secretion system F family protein [Bordetella genomosp. 13]|uniref:type II secretion system F family protein n=1 Tax=Bordetella genomosp. 13 TaxID=463040 RepID=UPI0011AB2A45|nr:type II secretion system F family protein [Bordetella genomosp. 13]
MESLLNDASMRFYLIGGLLAVMALMIGLTVFIVARAGRQDRSRQVVERALAVRDGQPAAAAEPHVGRVAAMANRAEQAGQKLGAGRMGHSLLDTDDRRLVELAGFEDVPRARALFVFGRFAFALILPVVLWLLAQAYFVQMSLLLEVCVAFAGFALGWLLPKWVLQRRVSRRKACAEEELPLLIDLIRLLQGVGLSIDQSLHILVTDFRSVLPVLGLELKIAIDQYARGRTREQSLTRIAQGFDNDDLAAICRLIVQVDKHGGAVQEPLARFGERVRERRKLELKAKVARMTVKMTGVMVLTLLPALLIITGGSGFVALLRGLSRVAGGL